VLCAEFLRSNLKSRKGLPKLAHLLMPIGRTLEAVDISGVASNGDNIFAQVTWNKKDPKKVHALSEYAAPGTHLIMFCDCPHEEEKDGITYFPISKALTEILDSSPHLARALKYHPSFIERRE
jgi:hypothetical protein